MLRLRIIHRLRTAAFILVLLLVLGSIGTLWWANATGMPKSWRQAIERVVAKQGIHVEIGSLSYHLLEGIIAREVTLFASEERKQVLARLEGVILDLDNAKLAKGDVQLARIKLDNAKLTLPVDPNDPNSEILEIDRLEGEFIPPGNPHIEIRNARGTISGIEIVLNAKIADDLPPSTKPSPPSGREQERELLARVVRELKDWSFDEEAPPEIRIQLLGRRSQPQDLRAKINFKARDIEKNQHRIESIEAEAELKSKQLTVHSLEVANADRKLEAQIDYSMERHGGRFNLDSTLEIPQLLQSWFEIQPLGYLHVAGEQELVANGEFTIMPDKPPSMHVTGRTRFESAMYRGVSFESMASSFSWRDDDLFLKDLELIRADGKVTGKVLIQDSLVRLDLSSTLLPRFYKPLFQDRPMEEVIERFASNPESRMTLELEGGFDLRDPSSWAYTGKASLHRIHYRGVNLASLDTSLSLSSSLMHFTDGSMSFDYSDYPMAKRFGGPGTGSAKFNSVRYERGKETLLTFSGLDGRFWPGPMCQMFLPGAVATVESYHFHRPPRISGSGRIGLGENKSSLVELEFGTPHPADYTLLGSSITLNQPKGAITITDQGTRIDSLEFNAFGGPVVASFDFPRGEAMSADIQLSNFSMDQISSAYKLNMNCGGFLSGTINYRMKAGQIGTMQGKGSFRLEQAELFSVPIFGPLSHLMQLVLNDERAGEERAKQASCNFAIVDGVVVTNDFRTTTNSLVFAGIGQVDLNDRTIDMTMRMNARGLLGVIARPFRPFFGFFQFHGTGPLSDPKWEREAYTKPDNRQHEFLLENGAPR
ncbi:MAG: AsmA-like C-terminal region-containing protein [Akkermansiaceae bacterium]|nr:AsmA-like C-terminal region-containing protein [Akkermansiaceae bacterium]